MIFRQELVFIGCELNEKLLRSRLDACLLSDQEMAEGSNVWDQYPDPFPEIAVETVGEDGEIGR